jgi:leader peptidase (prepilin peptidase)/N-methyltransferase
LEIIAFFLLGLLVGSFLNVCIVRMPLNLSIAWPGSHCFECKAPIHWYDNIPILSYLLLKGACRQCKTHYSSRYLWTEFAGGIALSSAYIIWDLTPYMAMGSIIFCVLIVIALIDIEHQIIPDEFTLGGIVVGLIFSAVYPGWHSQTTWLMGLRDSFLGIIGGGGFLWLLAIAAEKILKKEAMGGGDIKFLGAVGAFTGLQGAFLCLFIGSLLGSVGGLALKRFTGSERLAFGPYLAIGFAIALVGGDSLISWYLQAVLQY